MMHSANSPEHLWRACPCIARLAGKTVTAIAAGMCFTCAVADGRAYCWGEKKDGRLGNGTTADSWVPVAVKADSGLAGKTGTAITTGYAYSCAVADGKRYCWGDNEGSQLGNISTTTPGGPWRCTPTGR